MRPNEHLGMQAWCKKKDISTFNAIGGEHLFVLTLSLFEIENREPLLVK
jgi:hypothetical protein